MKANEIVPGCSYFHEKLGVVAVSFKATTSNLVKCFIKKPLSAASYCGECTWVYPVSLMSLDAKPKEELCATVNVNVKPTMNFETSITKLRLELERNTKALDLNTEAVNRSKDIFELPMDAVLILSEGLTLGTKISHRRRCLVRWNG